MNAVDITGETAARLSVPCAARVKLIDVLARVVGDGREALDSNVEAIPLTKERLEGCWSCAKSHSEHLCLAVVDGDEWEAAVHTGEKDCSVDFAVLMENDAERFFLPVEAKLGLAFEYPGDKSGSSVSLESLKKKYSGFLALVGRGKMAVSGKLILLVPRDGQEWMWYKVRDWNRIGSTIGKILSCCIDDFRNIVGLGMSGTRCASDNIRLNRLRQEFLSPTKMSPIQLAPVADCTACGKCRDVCKKHAIAMIPNDEANGELRPFIDTISCTKCGYCEKVCHVLARHKASLGICV